MSQMSIAIQKLLQPPLPIIAAVRIICSGFLFLAVAVGFEFGVEMVPQQKIFTIAVCLIASFCGIYYSCRLVKSFYISISSHGSIALTIGVSASGDEAINAGSGPQAAELMAGTTVWPSLIILRLQLADGRIVCIPVIKGFTDEQSFRILAVACKWILRQNDPAQGAKS